MLAVLLATASAVPVTNPAPMATCDDWPTVNNAVVRDGFCLNVWATSVARPRGIAVDDTGLVVVCTANSLTAMWDDDGDGISSSTERRVILSQSGLNHEVHIYGNYIYASTATTVYRWSYVHGSRANLVTPGQVLVTGIPNGGHVTRALAVDAQNRLYLHVGSDENVDDTSYRSHVLRFSLNTIPTGGYTWQAGELFADGLRNEAGLQFDADGLLWGVENGRDNLERVDMGGDIHNDNPCEELNAFPTSGQFYGYPYCWSDTGMDPVTGGSSRTQWADTEYFGNVTDAWCRDASNNVPPRWCMPAHMAPLGMAFYGNSSFSGEFSFPGEMADDLFVAMHGSWNRQPPAGYMIMHVEFQNGAPVASAPLIEYDGRNPPAQGLGWLRPVDVHVLQDGTLLFTSDANSTIYAIRYIGTAK
eukprot:TRINITY_DN2527_c0_g1_i1.p2 TRINITY_DN2527_c0_g1~~TRINITY_DN2527_c0_g1_i1.p2  ORF type:complete len:426 (-),score=86.22 TRINITY_DN2527_c0_g1_i1:59-1309(-)